MNVTGLADCTKDALKHISKFSMGCDASALTIAVDGDVRDVLKINTAAHQQIIISKNNDSIQVIQTAKK